MECYSSACVVLEDGERFVCRAGSSYNKRFFFFFFPCVCGKSGQGFLHGSELLSTLFL